MNAINRRKFLSNLSLATSAIAIPNFVYSSFIAFDEYIVAETIHGKIRGIRNNGVNILKEFLMREKFPVTALLRDRLHCSPSQEFVMHCS